MLPVHTLQKDKLKFSRRNSTGSRIRQAARWVALSSVVVGTFWVFRHILGLGAHLTSKFPLHPLHTEYEDKTVYPTPLHFEYVPGWDARKKQVKDAFLHAYGGYMKHAFPHDELASISGKHSDKFNGWGVTVFDSLDTMWIMGLQAEFYDALQFVKDHSFKINKGDKYIPFFETVIRYLGGLLSAHALSNEPMLLEKARELGDILLPAFNTTAGLPAYLVHQRTGRTINHDGERAVFAEIASCQMEFKYLAKLTGNTEYYEKAERVMETLYQEDVPYGLFSEKWLITGEPYGEHYTTGANVDSGYEYLLKQYLLTGDVKAKEQYIKSINGIIETLLYITPNRNLLFLAEETYGTPIHKQDHLACFLPGVLALGARTLSLPPEVKLLHEWAAKGLTTTCWISYADQPSGLGPDRTRMLNTSKRWIDVLKRWRMGAAVGDPPGVGDVVPEKGPHKVDYFSSMPGYYLRPETVESMYIMWKTTGNPIWRERGYEIFAALERHTKTPFGYASLRRVDRAPFYKIDDMPSYFLAETLKYLYLLFDDNDPIDIDKWVFNTEAHPFPVFEWSEREKERYNLTNSQRGAYNT